MNEQELYSINVRCINPPKMTFFYKGSIYNLKYHRMNDIVWYTCEDSNYIEHTFHENSWEKYFEKENEELKRELNWYKENLEKMQRQTKKLCTI